MCSLDFLTNVLNHICQTEILPRFPLEKTDQGCHSHAESADFSYGFCIFNSAIIGWFVPFQIKVELFDAALIFVHIKSLFKYLLYSLYIFQVIFIDEIDSICRKRSSREEEYTRRIKTELLKQVGRFWKQIFVYLGYLSTNQLLTCHSPFEPLCWLFLSVKAYSVYIINRVTHCSHGNSLPSRVQLNICELVRCAQISGWTLEEKFYIYTRPKCSSIFISKFCFFFLFLLKMEEADNPASMNHFILLCATNCPWELDSAFLRRFQKRIYIPLPDK